MMKKLSTILLLLTCIGLSGCGPPPYAKVLSPSCKKITQEPGATLIVEVSGVGSLDTRKVERNLSITFLGLNEQGQITLERRYRETIWRVMEFYKEHEDDPRIILHDISENNVIPHQKLDIWSPTDIHVYSVDSDQITYELRLSGWSLGAGFVSCPDE